MSTMPETAPLFDLPDAADLADAAALRAAVAVMRRRFGGLATTIAVLEQKAAALEAVAEQAPVWVRTCDRPGCILTSRHTHGTM